jgi:hypothetical protein
VLDATDLDRGRHGIFGALARSPFGTTDAAIVANVPARMRKVLAG